MIEEEDPSLLLLDIFLPKHHGLAATNQPLEQMVKEGKFREDLLYRLNGFVIPLSPLRDRIEDIPLLLETFSDARSTT